MATGKEWEEYFQTKSLTYLIRQKNAIVKSLKELDSKIVSEFQLTWLENVGYIINDIIRRKMKKEGGL